MGYQVAIGFQGVDCRLTALVVLQRSRIADSDHGTTHLARGLLAVLGSRLARIAVCHFFSRKGKLSPIIEHSGPMRINRDPPVQIFSFPVRPIYRLLYVTGASFLLATLLAPASADEFQLKTGGTIQGSVRDRGDNGEYLVRTDQGALVTLSRRQIDDVVAVDDIDQAYEERSRTSPDTVEAHRELANWCKENRRSKLAKAHLQRILELDPADEQARLKLGYQQYRGQWLTRDEMMAARGMRKYDGDYRTAQDIALRERTKRRERIETDWLLKLRTWVGWLDKRRSDEAVTLISEIEDPHAAVAIVKLLEREKNQRIRDLLTETLANLKTPLTVQTLVNFSLNDPDPEVRLQCLDYLLRYHRPINLEPYVQALNDRKYSNQIINRAGVALGEIGNPEAISPLIDALVTTHTFTNPSAPPGNISAGFGTSPNGGGGGLSMGGKKTKTVRRNLQNLKVRQALVELSGGLDYGFDEKIWRRWFVKKQIPDYVDARRDQ